MSCISITFEMNTKISTKINTNRKNAKKEEILETVEFQRISLVAEGGFEPPTSGL